MTNHLWQSTAFGALVALLAWAFRNHRASVRYGLWFSASVKFIIPLSLFMILGQRAEPTVAPLAPAIATAASHVTLPFRETIRAVGAPVQLESTPWIVAAWACGALAIVAMRLRAWLRIHRLARASCRHPITLPIEVRTCAGAVAPGLVGLWRSTLLLPEGIERYLTPRQLDAVLTHELCHAQRRDNLLAAVHMAVESLFWFHPLVWWIGARLAETRELACDEAVLARGSDPGEYAEAILNVCRRYVESPLACVSGMTGADLKKRMEAILSCRPNLPLDWSKKGLLAATAFIAVLIPFLAGITNAQSSKSFEVASVRLADRGTPRPFGAEELPPRLNGNSLQYTGTIHSLIVRAFGLSGCKDCDFVVGGPSWIREDWYRIEAKLPEGTPPYSASDFQSGKAEGVYEMIQSLLTDRFGLRMHRETKEVPSYALIEGPGGHKLTPSLEKMREYSDGTTRVDRRLGIVPFQSQGGVQMLRMSVTNLSLQDFATALSGWFDRPVVDRTGVSGRFDFTMEYEAETRFPPALGGPELVEAMRKHLGLRLEPGKAPVSVVSIDSIERPTDN